VEQSKQKAQELYEKYVTNQMVNECFWGGIGIQTPEGLLIAEVELIND
jgi:hypothetical protein